MQSSLCSTMLRPSGTAYPRLSQPPVLVFKKGEIKDDELVCVVTTTVNMLTKMRDGHTATQTCCQINTIVKVICNVRHHY